MTYHTADVHRNDGSMEPLSAASSTGTAAAHAPGGGRIVSLDQFRGYTVLGMFLVNFLGHFQVIPAILKHHNTYCSYADTIMPHFVFAVGFAFRLTWMRRSASGDRSSRYWRVLRRSLGLILLGIVVYHLDGGAKSWTELAERGWSGFFRDSFQRRAFQALVHIGVTTLWVLPVIGLSPAVRVLYAAGSALLHIGLSHAFYFEFAMRRPVIDGGPLGFLTWTTPLLAGAAAFDIMHGVAAGSGPSGARYSRAIRRLLAAGAMMMLLGYAVSCLRVGPERDVKAGAAPAADSRDAFRWAAPPFVGPVGPVTLWTMSQRAGSVSYLVFGAGFSLAVYAAFVALCDVGRWRLGLFQTFGSNALAAYVIHELVSEAIRPFTPADSPLWFALLTFALFLGITYLFVRYLEENRIFLRL